MKRFSIVHKIPMKLDWTKEHLTTSLAQYRLLLIMLSAGCGIVIFCAFWYNNPDKTRVEKFGIARAMIPLSIFLNNPQGYAKQAICHYATLVGLVLM